MGKNAVLKCVMLVQQLDSKYWSNLKNGDCLLKARDGDCKPLLKMIVQNFEDDGISVQEAYGIIHDQDMKINKVKKAVHVHFLFKFTRGGTLNRLALSAGQDVQYLEKVKSGRYGFDNCLAYLIHAKDRDKFQYSPEKVVTVLGTSYQEIVAEEESRWIRGRASKEARETTESVDWLVSQVLEGKIKKRDIFLNNNFYKIYGQHKRKVNEALDTYGERKGYKAIDDLEKNRFKKTVLYIQGKSGEGKTRLVKEIIKELEKKSHEFDENWDSCLTAANNPFDEYSGQEILFLDDVRGGSMLASDWLKLLDPYMISPISARYHNKMGAAKIIVITSTIKPQKFFKASGGGKEEDLGQFYRRIDLLLKMGGGEFAFFEPIKESGRLEVTYTFALKNMSLDKKDAIHHILERVSKNMKWGYKNDGK